MNCFTKLLTGSFLTLLIANHAFAADSAPAAAQAKPAATEISAAATTAPAAAAPAAPAASAPAAAAPAASASAPKEQALKIGYVDMVKVGLESPTGKAAASSMKAKSAKLRAKIEAKQKQLEKEKAAIESKIDGMSAKERAAKGKQFQKKVEEYQKLVRSSEDEMQQMQAKLTDDLLKVIKKAAASYAKSHGYAAIVDEKAVLYISDAIEPTDLTDELAASLGEKKK